MKKNQVVYLVVTIRENVVYEVQWASTSENMERLFHDECSKWGVEPTDVNYDDGYMELEDGTSICMTTMLT
jgi:hypothetical protein